MASLKNFKRMFKTRDLIFKTIVNSIFFLEIEYCLWWFFCFVLFSGTFPCFIFFLATKQFINNIRCFKDVLIIRMAQYFFKFPLKLHFFLGVGDLPTQSVYFNQVFPPHLPVSMALPRAVES